MDYCVVNTHTNHIYQFCTPENAAQVIEAANASLAADLAQLTPYATADRPHILAMIDGINAQRGKYAVIAYAEYERMERERLLSDPLEEISEERYFDMLNVLPPLYMRQINGVEMFSTSEMYTGTYNTQYARDTRTGKYYAKMVDCADRSTWIHNILRAE